MFDQNGDLDLPGTAQHVEYLIRSGAHGLVAAGTSGEFISMTIQERLRVIQIIHQTAAGRVPVYAHTGHYSTKLTIEMTRTAEDLGVDGILVILPYYQRPPVAAIKRHFKVMSEATLLPIMLYNNPANTASLPLSHADVSELVNAGWIQSIKSTFETVVPVHDLLVEFGDDFRIFYGSFMSPMDALLAGAHGWISGFLNFLTIHCVSLYCACQSGDVAKAREIWQGTLLPFKNLWTHQVLGPVNDLAIYRAGLDLMGHHGGYSRLPFEPLNDTQKTHLKQMMSDRGLLA
ncbi:MAG: dihydrodipicolinate synthase family protein [Phycisphaeraceae bacterium]|nr:dihydrodipicolinate synthase family protein [Phycisphaeraceae bacterium]